MGTTIYSMYPSIAGCSKPHKADITGFEMVKPRYRNIFESLSRDIMTGRYQPGQKFPSEAALVKRFGASRITVGHALRDLQHLGLVDRIAGSGTYVRSPAGQGR